MAGEPQTGLTYLTRSFLEDAAQNDPTPSDWCYVYNFHEPDSPRAISLPAGLGKQFAREMDELVKDLKSEIPEIFESEDYRQRREEIIKKFAQERNRHLSELERRSRRRGSSSI